MNHAESLQRVLVLCTGNRCRSQMAEGWFRHHGKGRLEVCSAGTQPKGVHPLAIQVMHEAGIDISGQTSDHVDQYKDQSFDVVLTVCDAANEACPTFPNAGKLIHHAFPDPDKATGTEDEVLAVFRDVRDQIGQWVENFLREHHR